MSVNTEESIKRTLSAIKKTPPLIYVLLFVGRVGVATHTQCYELLELFLKKRGDHDDLEKLIAAIMTEALIKQFLREVEPDCDTNGQRILYLSPSGFEEVSKYNRRIAIGLNRDTPTPTRVKKILHDLLGAAGYIWLNTWGYIYQYTSESELRGENMRLRHRIKNAKFMSLEEAPEDSALADFRVGLIYFDGLHATELNCEAVVKYSAERLKSKSHIHEWFAGDQYQADNINSLTAKTARVFTPLLDRPPPGYHVAVNSLLDVLKKSCPEGVNHLNPLENKIFKLMKKLGLILTIDDVREFVGGKKTNLEQAAANLKRTGAVSSRSVQVTAGGQTRRREYFYLTENEKFLTSGGLYRQLLLSVEMMVNKRNDYHPRNIDLKNSILTVAQVNFESATMADDITIPVHKVIEKLLLCQERRRGGISLIVADEERFDRIKNVRPDIHLHSLRGYSFKI